MKFTLIVLMSLLMACSLHAKSSGNLSIYGNINEVKVNGGDVSIVFTGIAHFQLNDPSLKEQMQYFSLSQTVIHLKFDNRPQGMHTYSRYRYLDWINEEQAVSILNECHKKSVDVNMMLDTDAVTYSRIEGGDGALRISSLSGTIDVVSPWANLFKESILEYTKKYMTVRYDLIQPTKPTTEQVAPPEDEKPSN